MPFVFDGKRYQGLSEFIDLSSSMTVRKSSGQAPPYAHPIDSTVISALEKTMLTPAVADWLDTILLLSHGKVSTHSLTISSHNYPDVHEMVVECARRLDIPIPHVYVSQHQGMNASTSGTDEYAFIEITSGILNDFSPAEQKFVIGHECGHLAAGHVVYRSLANMIVDGASRPLGLAGAIARKSLLFPLKAWSRRAEITADRAGFICCGDLDVAEQALVKLLVPEGVTRNINIDGRIDVDDYLRRVDQMKQIQKPGILSEIEDTHPRIHRRVRALRLFARSEMYYRITGLSPAPGISLISDDQLNNAVGNVAGF